MEFKEFYKERERMCKSQKGAIICERCFCDCPLNSAMTEYRDEGSYLCDYWIARNPEKAEEIVSEWAKEHPLVTNADKFREVFGTEFNDAMSEIGMWHWQSQEYKPPRKENADES